MFRGLTLRNSGNFAITPSTSRRSREAPFAGGIITVAADSIIAIVTDDAAGDLRYVKLWRLSNCLCDSFDLRQENSHNVCGLQGQRRILGTNNKVSAEEGIRMKLPFASGTAAGLRALPAFLLRAGTER
jgi:hypothetical protein